MEPGLSPPADPSAEQLLLEGIEALQRQDRDLASTHLVAARSFAPTRLRAHNLIERHGLAGAFSQWVGVNCEISPHDDIFRFFDGHPTSINPLRDYFADGWRTLAELMALLESVDLSLIKMGSILEFACGHGRLTRHLAQKLGGVKIVVSDIVADAVEFARNTFAVQGFESKISPADLIWPDQYELVFVLSLFSHLPHSSWGPWLGHLLEAVKPGGALIFSTHGQHAALREGVMFDDEGFFFAPSSESHALDRAQYGTTFTSPAYVRAQITQWASAAQLLAFCPLCFWNYQDAWVLKRCQ